MSLEARLVTISWYLNCLIGSRVKNTADKAKDKGCDRCSGKDEEGGKF